MIHAIDLADLVQFMISFPVQVSIYGSNNKLLEAWMINGVIDVEVPKEIAKLSNWKAPIRIGVHKGERTEFEEGTF